MHYLHGLGEIYGQCIDEAFADNEPGIMRAAKQYGVHERIIDLCTFDITHNPFRCGGLFDAIVTDPPCE